MEHRAGHAAVAADDDFRPARRRGSGALGRPRAERRGVARDDVRGERITDSPANARHADHQSVSRHRAKASRRRKGGSVGERPASLCGWGAPRCARQSAGINGLACDDFGRSWRSREATARVSASTTSGRTGSERVAADLVERRAETSRRRYGRSLVIASSVGDGYDARLERMSLPLNPSGVPSRRTARGASARC